MSILFVSKLDKEYEPGVFQVTSSLPENMLSEYETLQEVYPVVKVQFDVPSNISGYPERLVVDTTTEIIKVVQVPVVDSTDITYIDATSVEIDIIREKNEYEYLVDLKFERHNELKNYTRELINSVANSEKQRSLALLYSDLTGDKLQKYDEYKNWHKNILQRYYSIRLKIYNCQTLNELNSLDFLEEFSDLAETSPKVELEELI